MLSVWAWNQWGLFNRGTRAGTDKSIFYPLFVNAHTLVSVQLAWGGLAPLCLCPHPHLLPAPDSYWKSSLLTCQPLFPSTLTLQIPAKCILLSLQEGMSLAVCSYGDCVCEQQLITHGFFQRIFNLIFGCLMWRKGQRKVQSKWKACKRWSGFVLHWGIFCALLVV